LEKQLAKVRRRQRCNTVPQIAVKRFCKRQKAPKSAEKPRKGPKSPGKGRKPPGIAEKSRKVPKSAESVARRKAVSIYSALGFIDLLHGVFGVSSKMASLPHFLFGN